MKLVSRKKYERPKPTPEVVAAAQKQGCCGRRALTRREMNKVLQANRKKRVTE